MDEEQQALGSPIAGGLRGIRRNISSSIFGGRRAPDQVQGDNISSNLIAKNSLALENVSLQLTSVTEQVNSVNKSLEAIKSNLALSDSLEKRQQQAKERREATLAEEGLREGAESQLEKKIQFALLTPVRKVANFAKGILSRITDSLLFLAGGWLIDQTLTFFRLTSEGNVEGLKKFKDQLIGNLIVMGGLTTLLTVGLGKLLAQTKLLGATLLNLGVRGILIRPFQALFNFIGVNLLKFKNLLLLGLGGAFQKVIQNPQQVAKAARESKITNTALQGAGVLTIMGNFLGNQTRKVLNIGRKILGRPIVTKAMFDAKTAANIASKGKELGPIAKGMRGGGRTLGKFLGLFNKVYYAVEGFFDFADSKNRGNSNVQALLEAFTRTGTKVATYAAGMKTGAFLLGKFGMFAGGFFGGPAGAAAGLAIGGALGGILGALGVSFGGLDQGAADFTGGLMNKITGAKPKLDTAVVEPNNQDGAPTTTLEESTGDGKEIFKPVDAKLNLSSEAIVPFKKNENVEQKLALNESINFVNIPLPPSGSNAIADTGSSKTGANKVPTFSSSDYANVFPSITENMFNVSTV